MLRLRPNPLTHVVCGGAIAKQLTGHALECTRCHLVIADARELQPHSGWVPRPPPVRIYREL